jgi:hypothetical protein
MQNNGSMVITVMTAAIAVLTTFNRNGLQGRKQK